MTTSAQDSILLARKVLGDNYCEVKVKSIVVSENLDKEDCHISLSLHHGPTIESAGVGMVDAIFNGLREHYSTTYSSLTGVELNRFFLRPNPIVPKPRSVST